jgi:hypothetical protein
MHMNASRLLGVSLLLAAGIMAALVPCGLTGCSQQAKDKLIPQPAKSAETKKEAPESQSDAADIKAALAKLSPDDRKLAEQQKYCVMQTEELLGSMGTPIKLTIKDTPVFICCNGCKKDAEANPDKTLKTLAELKTKNATAASGR